MINSVISRGRDPLQFGTGIGGTNLVFTTTERSFITIEFFGGSTQNGNVEIRNNASSTYADKIVFARWDDVDFGTNGSGGSGRTYSCVVPSGTPIYASASRVGIYLHVWEIG